MNRILALASALGFIASWSSVQAADDIQLRAIGITSSHTHHTALEKAFYGNLAKKTGLNIQVNFNPLDVVGVDMKDTLRVVRNGTFDVVQSTIGPAARDDIFLEGIDLIGVSPELGQLRDVVKAYEKPFRERVAKRFNARVMALWPYGPQIFYCNDSVKAISDLKQKKVRSYTASMSALVSALGAIPVTLDYPEVYMALQRGVIDCAITSPTSGNTGKWPEVTTQLLPAGIAWAVNAHWMNLDAWKKLSADQQAKLDAAFKDLENQFWDMARKLADEAIACNVGDDSCKDFAKYKMNRVAITNADRKTLAEAVEAKILPEWGKACNDVYSECVKVWNGTVGKVRGMTISN